MAEYRLDELARISGVSARNIRAYRERGLLDPPRRVGRSAFYDDYHLSQLRTISQLLRRGFNSAHIAEFFASMREGADLADILGIQRAVLGPRDDEEPGGEKPETTNGEAPATAQALAIDPGSDEARSLVEHGFAAIRDGKVVVADAPIAYILTRASDPLTYVRALLQIAETTQGAVDGLVEGFVAALQESVTARFGDQHDLTAGEIDELTRIVQDYRDLWSRVVSERLDQSLQRQMANAVSGSTADILLSAHWQSASRHTTPR